VALLFPAAFTAWLSRPELYLHAKFIHVLSVTLFFANAVIGTIWEARSLVCGTPEIIRYTYRTVAWLDAVFTAPLILIAVCSGIMLGTILGGVGSIGWVSTTLFLFGVSGTVWVLLDIPMQYRVNRLFETVEPQCPQLPQPLRRLLWRRMGINFLGMLPLLVGFYLMVHKPAIPTVASWFHSLKITKNR
jgi:uncharacterized membrane protein